MVHSSNRTVKTDSRESSKNFNFGHYVTLSISNFVLMMVQVKIRRFDPMKNEDDLENFRVFQKKSKLNF
jgi:hypothetical protein